MDALARTMDTEHKMAIIIIVPRQNTLLKFAALVPKWNNEEKEKVIGFTMIFLPFADDIRDPSSLPQATDGIVKPSSDQVKAAKAMINQLKLPRLEYADFFNPNLQHFYYSLEDIALEKQTEQPLDTLLPDYQHIET